MTTEQPGRMPRLQNYVVLSDTHCGSEVGIWPEVHRVEGGGPLGCNKYQAWLLECWTDMLHQVKQLRPRPVVVHNGDSIQGVNMKDGGLITPLFNIQSDAVEEMLKPLRDVAKAFYMIRGTEWHEGKAADHVEPLAKALHAERDPNTGQYTRWELHCDTDLRPDIEGPAIHFAHHVGVSSVPWYEATVPLRDTLLQLSELWRFYGKAAPNMRMAVRSHRHRMIHVQAPPDLQVVVTPGWQLKTAFSYKKAASMLPQIGWVLIQIQNGEMVVKPRIYDLPAPLVVKP